MWSNYGKALAALFFAALTAASAALTDGSVTRVEWVQIVIAVVTTLGVVLVPIHPEWTWTKTVVAALLAGLNVVVTFIANGATLSNWIEVALAVLTALGVAAAPAASRRKAAGGGYVGTPEMGR